ncbi:MAG TPA: hypothetical protein VKY92_14000 [Verrucomicrobiae bacterium]|nr:hypothetical protein [Verrucomicrobiae bacterium]
MRLYPHGHENQRGDELRAALRPGQLWKTDNGCILITHQGNRIIGYRKLRNREQKAALTNLIRPEALACYLNQIGAVLEN